MKETKNKPNKKCNSQDLSKNNQGRLLCGGDMQTVS